MLLCFYAFFLTFMVGFVSTCPCFRFPLLVRGFPLSFFLPSLFPSGRFLAPLIGAWFAPEFPFLILLCHLCAGHPFLF